MHDTHPGPFLFIGREKALTLYLMQETACPSNMSAFLCARTMNNPSNYSATHQLREVRDMSGSPGARRKLLEGPGPQPRSPDIQPSAPEIRKEEADP